MIKITLNSTRCCINSNFELLAPTKCPSNKLKDFFLIEDRAYLFLKKAN